MEQRPVHDEPEEDVDEKEWDRVPTEQEVDGPGRQQSEEHALRKRLQEDCVRAHRRTKFGPPAEKNIVLRLLERQNTDVALDD